MSLEDGDAPAAGRPIGSPVTYITTTDAATPPPPTAPQRMPLVGRVPGWEEGFDYTDEAGKVHALTPAEKAAAEDIIDAMLADMVLAHAANYDSAVADEIIAEGVAELTAVLHLTATSTMFTPIQGPPYARPTATDPAPSPTTVPGGEEQDDYYDDGYDQDYADSNSVLSTAVSQITAAAIAAAAIPTATDTAASTHPWTASTATLTTATPIPSADPSCSPDDDSPLCERPVSSAWGYISVVALLGSLVVVTTGTLVALYMRNQHRQRLEDAEAARDDSGGDTGGDGGGTAAAAGAYTQQEEQRQQQQQEQRKGAEEGGGFAGKIARYFFGLRGPNSGALGTRRRHGRRLDGDGDSDIVYLSGSSDSDSDNEGEYGYDSDAETVYDARISLRTLRGLELERLLKERQQREDVQMPARLQTPQVPPGSDGVGGGSDDVLTPPYASCGLAGVTLVEEEEEEKEEENGGCYATSNPFEDQSGYSGSGGRFLTPRGVGGCADSLAGGMGIELQALTPGKVGGGSNTSGTSRADTLKGGGREEPRNFAQTRARNATLGAVLGVAADKPAKSVGARFGLLRKGFGCDEEDDDQVTDSDYLTLANVPAVASVGALDARAVGVAAAALASAREDVVASMFSGAKQTIPGGSGGPGGLASKGRSSAGNVFGGKKVAAVRELVPLKYASGSLGSNSGSSGFGTAGFTTANTGASSHSSGNSSGKGRYPVRSAGTSSSLGSSSVASMVSMSNNRGYDVLESIGEGYKEN